MANDNRFIKIGNPGSDTSIISWDDNDQLIFGTEGSFLDDGITSFIELMRIEREGGTDSPLVGINNSDPQQTLSVGGDINFTGLIYGNGSKLTDVAAAPDVTWRANWTAYNTTWSSTTNSSYIPYTGADTNINLGEYNFTTTGTGVFGFIDVEEDLNVSGDSSFGGDLLPRVTLTSDIGSGPLRWDWLYVRNISVENIDLSETFNISGNVSANYYFGNGSQLTDVVAEPDPSWIANWTAYNSTWSTDLTYNDTQNQSLNNYINIQNTSQTNYLAENNVSVENYILYVNSTNPSGSYDATWVANWTAYNTTWSTDLTYNDTQNQSLVNYINVNNNSVTNTIQTDNNSMNNYITENNNSVNNNIEDKLITTFYNVTSIDDLIGTGVGELANITAFNGGAYNITETSSDFELRVNFTGITDFNQFVYRFKTEAAESHIMHAQLWSYTDSTWHCVAEEGERDHFGVFSYPIFDAEDHISDEVVQVRFYTTNVGGSTHVWSFDWVTIADGPATPSSSESDPFSLRKDGTTPLTANWGQGAFNLTNVASWFLGLISWDRINGLNSTIDSLILTNNASVENYILYVNSTNGDGSSDSTWVANWTAYNITWSTE